MVLLGRGLPVSARCFKISLDFRRSRRVESNVITSGLNPSQIHPECTHYMKPQRQI